MGTFGGVGLELPQLLEDLKDFLKSNHWPTNQQDYRFQINWRNFPGWVASEAAKIAQFADYTYEGAIIYASNDPNSDPSFRRWLTTWLDRQPGIQVVALE